MAYIILFLFKTEPINNGVNPPGGYYWDYYIVALYFTASHCNAFEDRITVKWPYDEVKR